MFALRSLLTATAAVMLASGTALAHGGGHGGGGHGGGGHGGVAHGGFGGVSAIHPSGGFGLYGGGFSHGLGYASGMLLGRGYGPGVVGYGLGIYGGGFAHGLGYGNGLLYGRGYGLGTGLGYGLGYNSGIGFGLYGRGYGLGLGYGLGYTSGYGWPAYGLRYGGYGLGYGYGGLPYGYYGSAPSAVQGYSSAYPPVAQAPIEDNTAHVRVIVPDNAELWFNDAKTKQTGPVREFVSPPLTPGKKFTYDIVARWQENGSPVERKRSIQVQANNHQVVDFTRTEEKTAVKQKR